MSFLISIVQEFVHTLIHSIAFTTLHVGSVKFSFIGIDQIISAILKFIH